jgi:hypothetical protein
MIDPWFTEMLEMIQKAPKDKRADIIKKIREVPTSVEALWTETVSLNDQFVRVRIDILQDAGWDPAGWSIMEWSRFPLKLKADLNRLFPKYQKIIENDRDTLLKYLGEKT